MFWRRPAQSHVREDASSAAARYQVEMNFARMGRRPVPVSWGLLLSLVVVHLACGALGLVGATPGVEDGALFFGAKVNTLIAQGQWWRLVSCLFLHGNLLHLGFNGYALFILGPLLERFYGPRRFLALYVLSGVGASLASFWFTQGPSVGASGAVFGLLGALMVFGFRQRRRLPARISRALGAGMAPWVVINLVIGLIPGLPIDNAAHVGGLVVGSALALVSHTSLHPASGRLRSLVVELLFALSLLAVAASAVMGLQQVATCAGSGVRFYQCYPSSLLAPEP